MKLEHYSAEKLEKEILGVIGKYLDLNKYRVFFFGSRVAGKASERSDIDIGIDGHLPIPFEIIFDIKEELKRLPILYKIDVVDFQSANLKFQEVARQYTEAIN